MKRLFLILSVALLVLSVWSVSVCASEQPLIGGSNTDCFPGETISIEIQMKNNPGFAYLEITPEYPVEFGEPNVVNGEMIPDLTMGLQYVWLGEGDVETDGTLYTVSFDLPSTIHPGQYMVNLTFRAAMSWDEEAIVFDVAPATVTVLCPHEKTTTHAGVAPTCLTVGRSAYATCDVCGAIVSGTDTELPPGEHTYDEIINQTFLFSSASCQSGTRYHKSCTLCGAIAEETFEVGDILPHTLGEWLPAEEGHVRRCSCGYGESQPHSFDEGIITLQATEVSCGVMTYTCSVCGETEKATIAPISPQDDKPIVPDNPDEPSDGDNDGGQSPERRTTYVVLTGVGAIAVLIVAVSIIITTKKKNK